MIRIFLAYASADRAYMEEFKKHLAPLAKTEMITIWDDGEIVPGGEWRDEVKKELNSAEIFIPLVSADFFASRYCYDVELSKAIDQYAKNRTRIVPLIIRDCDWRNTAIDKFQVLNKGTPCPGLHNSDEWFSTCAKELRDAIQKKKQQMEKAENERLLAMKREVNKANRIISEQDAIIKSQRQVLQSIPAVKLKPAGKNPWRKYLLPVLLLCGITALAVWWWQNKTGGNGEKGVKKVKIGVILSLSSGNMQDAVSNKMKAGIEEATFSVNQKNEGKIFLEPVYADTKGMYENIIPLTNEFRKKGIDIIITAPFSGYLEFAQEATKNRKIVLITNAKYNTGQRATGYSFNTAIPTQKSVLDMLSFTKTRLGADTALLIYDYSLPDVFGSQIVKDNKVTIIGKRRSNETVLGLSAYLAGKAQRRKAIIVWGDLPPFETISLLKEIRSLYPAVPVIAENLYRGLDLRITQEKLDSNFYIKESSSVEENAYFSLMANSGDSVYKRAEQEYFDIVYLLAAAIRESGDNPDKIAAYLRRLTEANPFHGLSKNISFDSTGKLNGHSAFYKLINGVRVKEGF